MNIKQEDTNDVLQEIEQISNDYSTKHRKRVNTKAITTANEEDYDDEILNENVPSVQPKQLNYNNNFQSLTPITLPLFSSDTSFLANNFYPPNHLALLDNAPTLINCAQLQQNAILFNPTHLMPIQPHGGVHSVFYMGDTSNIKAAYPSNNNVYNSFAFDTNNTNKPPYHVSNTNTTANNTSNNHDTQQPTATKRVSANAKDKKSKTSAPSNKDSYSSAHQPNSSVAASSSNNTNTNSSNTSNTNTNSNTNSNSALSKKIVIDDIITGKEKRTTLMLRNIPNKYTLTNLVEELNPSFWGKFDYINLPIDYDRKLNLGYAFINFVDPMHIILFYETYRLKKWSKYRSDKKMDMTYADKQGKKDINCKDEQTYFAENDKRFNFSKLQLKIEIPISHLDFFKKIYMNSVCVVQQDKHPIYNDKCFIVKSFGKKI